MTSNSFSEITTRGTGAFLGIVLLSACAADEPPLLHRASVSAPTAVVEMTTVPTTRALAGTVVSANVSPLAAKVMGNVVRVLVAEGDAVRAGQLLVEIDSREGTAQTEQMRAGGVEIERAIDGARANAVLAEATLRRYGTLLERGSVSAQEFDDVEARHAAATAELARMLAKRDQVRAAGRQARTFLDYSFVRSPIDGVVTRRFVDPGAQAAPGMPLVTVEDARAFRVETTVPGDLHARPGDPVTIEIGGVKLEGRIANVQPGVDATSRSALVKIALPSETARPASAPSLRSGAYARVLLPTGERAALTVPESAVVRRGQLTSVFVVGDDGLARMRLVTLGRDGEVLSGLAAGERIVTEASKVSDGAKVV